MYCSPQLSLPFLPLCESGGSVGSGRDWEKDMGLTLGLPCLFLCTWAQLLLRQLPDVFRKLCKGFRLPVGWSGLDSGCILVSLMYLWKQ